MLINKTKLNNFITSISDSYLASYVALTLGMVLGYYFHDSIMPTLINFIINL